MTTTPPKIPTGKALADNSRLGRIVIDLSSGLSAMFRPEDAQGLEQANQEPLGRGGHFTVTYPDPNRFGV